MKTAADILRLKPESFNFVHSAYNALEAIRLLSSLNCSFLVVMDDDGYKGVFTEHALVHYMAAPNWNPAEKNVADVMETNLPIATVENTTHELMNMMIAHHVRYVPVFDGHHFAGIITLNNLLKAMLASIFSSDDFSGAAHPNFDTVLPG